MVKKFLIPAITAVFALAACSKEIQEQRTQSADSGEVHSLSVEIESGAYGAVEGDTKASMEAVIRVKWKKDDEVSVVNATTGKLLGGCLKAEEDGESVVFTGSVTGTITQGNSLYYIYPRVTNNTEEVAFDSYDISLAAQTYDGKKIGDVCFYGYAQDQAGSADNNISKKIKFTLVTSYAHLNMANLPARNTGLSRIDISNVNEGFTWKLNGGVLSAAAYAGNNAISVRCSNADISKAGNAVARFAIPASAETATDRVVTVNNAYTNSNYVKSELKASAYYNQLYTKWTNSNVSIDASGTKTVVTIDNRNSKDVAEGAIPTEAFGTTGQTSKPTEVKIGGMGTVTFDEDATARIFGNADAAGATSVLLKVEDVTTTKPVPNADVVYEVTMKTLDENGKEVFPDAQGTADADRPGTATISILLDEDVVYVRTITLVDNDGNPISGGVIPESIVLDLTNHILTFKVEHFSKYAVGYVKRADFIPVTGVSLNKNTLTLPVDETETLVATVAPDNATNKKVKWTSSNTAVATVDKDGKVTAVAYGTATITVTTEDGNKTAVCTVTVTETKTMAELLSTNPDIPEVNDLTPPSNAWVNSSDSDCKAFVGIDEQGDKIFTAWKCIPGTEEDAIVNFGLLMTDVFVRTDENTYTYSDDISTVIATMTEGKFTSCEFIFDSSAIQQIIEDGGPAELAEVPILAGTYVPGPPLGALPGVFSVSPSKKVCFSQGNLYWDGSAFRFETNQYSFANSWDAEHVSHFFWSKTASVAYAASYNDGSKSTSDVFFTNKTTETAKSDFTVNGVEGQYRTLFKDEWTYLFTKTSRMVNSKPCFSDAALYGVEIEGSNYKGVFLYPDNYSGDVISNNSMTWDQINAAGIVFLPAAGFRNEYNQIKNLGYGYYCSSSASSNDSAYFLAYYDNDYILPDNSDIRSRGNSVRLVTDAK